MYAAIFDTDFIYTAMCEIDVICTMMGETNGNKEQWVGDGIYRAMGERSDIYGNKREMVYVI